MMKRLITKAAPKSEAQHPGKIIEVAMHDHGLTPPAFAKSVGISVKYLKDLIDGKADINRASAGKFGRYFKNGSNAWLKMQALFDEKNA